jgi:hypothetical protein
MGEKEKAGNDCLAAGIPDNCIDSRRRRWHISCQKRGRGQRETAVEPESRSDWVSPGPRQTQLCPEGERNREIRARPRPRKVLTQCSPSQEKLYYQHRACSSGDRATDF